MNISTARKILKTYHGVHSRGWHWHKLMREFAKTQPITSYWWEDRHRKNTEYTIKSWKGLPDVNKESAYDSCIKASFEIRDNIIYFETILYEGDFDGVPLEPRCVFRTQIKKMFPEFKDLLLTEIQNKAIDEYEDRLELERQAMIKSIMYEMLRKFGN